MALITRVARAMQKIAPLELAETAWDNVGILVEPPFPRPQANNVFLTIDLTPKVLEEAISDAKIGAIVAYHPPIFKAMKRLTSSDPKQDMVLKAIAHGIGIFSPHTAADNTVNGVNDWLARGLGEGTAEAIEAAQNPPEGQEGAGSGRLFTYASPMSIQQVIKNVKQHLDMSILRVATAQRHEDGHLITTVGICAGSGASLLGPVKADLYLSGEMGHHDVLEALANGTSVILCEHSNTERGFLKAALQDRLGSIMNKDGGDHVEVKVSKHDKDPLQFV